MRPAARVQAAIEILDRIAGGGAPADAEIRHYFRSRRYAGAKDRRWTGDAVYRVLRRWFELSWRLEGSGVVARRLMLAHLATAREGDLAPEAIFAGETHGPPPLDAEEAGLVARLEATGAAPPAWARANAPAWLWPDFEARFGGDSGPELAALNTRAPVDLRVNRLRAERDGVLRRLTKDGIAAQASPFSPDGIRLEGRPALENHVLTREGRIEVQDEASQIVSRLVEASSGSQVVDLCAGAGGKTLALAAVMANSGQIHAFDIDNSRLAELKRRVQRAGVRNVQARALPDDAAWRADLGERADRVLVDAPCSGIGTWRRQPEGRLRLTPEHLARHSQRQRALLAKGAGFVKPGGRLIYAVCSPLRAEGEDVIEAFLAAQSAFRQLDIADIWPRVLDGAAPLEGPSLVLTPARHGTDGFFVAVLERAA